MPIKLLPANLVVYKSKIEVVPVIPEAQLEIQVTKKLIKRNPRSINNFSFSNAEFRHAAVNHLRHNSWNYSCMLRSFKTSEEKKDWKIKLMWKISKQYPVLKKECFEQIKKLLED